MSRRNLIRWLSLLTVIGITFKAQNIFAEELVSGEMQDVYHEESIQSDEISMSLESEVSIDTTVEIVDEIVIEGLSEEPSLVQVSEENLEKTAEEIIHPSPASNGFVEENATTYLYQSGVKQYDTVYANGNAKFYFETTGVLSRQKWSYSNKTATWYYSDANGEIIKEAAQAHYVERGKQLYDIVVDINHDRYYYEPQYWGGVQARHKWAYGVKDATWYYTDATGKIRKEANRQYYKHDGVGQSDTVLDINGTRYYYEPQYWGGIQARHKWAYGVKDATWYYTDATGKIRKEANRQYYKHDGVRQSDTVLDINGTRYYYEPQYWGGIQARSKWAYGVKDATWYYTDATGKIRKEANRQYYKHDGVRQSDTVLDINGTYYYYEPATWNGIQARSKWSYGVKDATWYETNQQGHIINRSKTSPFVSQPKKEIITEIRKEAVQFGTDNLNDPQLDKGKIRVEAGVLGEDTLTYEVTKVDGVVTSTRLLKRQRTKEPINKKVYTGSKDVIAVRTYVRDEVIPVPTTVEQLNDVNLAVGQTRFEEGMTGLERVTYRVVSTNGVEGAPEVITRHVLKQAVAPKRYTGVKVETPKLPPVVPEQPPVVAPEMPPSEPIVPPTNEREVVKQLSETKIELKNIQSAYLYKVHNNQIQRVLTLTSPEGTYYIKATLEDGRDIWLDVAQITEDGNGYLAHASLSDMVTLSQDSKYRMGYTITIPKRSVSPQSTMITTFSGLLEAIRQNTAGTFTIENHLSADEVSLTDEQQSYILSAFSGTLTADSKHRITIFDLKKPLFNQLLNAKISNIQFQDGHVRSTTDNQVGLLAKVADASTMITNVHAKGSVTGYDEVGGLVGRLDNQAGATNVSFTGYVSSEKIGGGIAGVVTRGAIVSQAYANITIASMSRQEMVRVGGLIGNLGEHATLENSFVEGRISNYSAPENVGGAIGQVSVATDTPDTGRIQNVLSAVDIANGHSLIGNIRDLTGKALSQLKIYQNQSNITASQSGEPTVVDAATTNAFRDMFKKIELHMHNRQVNDYQKLFGYRESYQQAYRNLEKLLPFFDRETIVEHANRLPNRDDLVVKSIASLQVKQNDQLVTKLHNNVDKVNRLVVHYADGTHNTLTLITPKRFKQTGIYTYQISDKNIQFQLDRFVTDYSSLVRSITQAVQAKGFTPELFNQYNITKSYYDNRSGVGVPVQEVSKHEKIRQTYLDSRFNQVKQELNDVLYRLLEEDDIYTNGTKLLEAKLHQAQNALLVGLTYVDRWYNFGKLKEHVLFNLPTSSVDKFGSGLDMVLALGHETTDSLDSRLTAVTYSQVIAPYTKQWTLAELIQRQVNQERSTDTSVDTWLKEVAMAYLVTTQSPYLSGQNKIFNRLLKPQNTYMILPLLSGKANNVYAIFTTDSAVFGIMDTYLANTTDGEYKRVKELIQTSGASIQQFFDLLHRVLKPEAIKRLKNTNLTVFDSYLDKWTGWKGISDDVVKEFAAPIGRWIQFNSRDGAYAQGENVHFVRNKVLTEAGLSTLTHEHTHNIDSKVLFNNYGRRGSNGPENYALGLFQSVATGSTTHGFNLVYEVAKNQYNWYYNSSPQRFQTIDDFQTYYRRLFDVIYTLDHAEADVIIRKGTSYIEQNYRKLEALPVRHSYHKQDQVTHLNSLGTVTSINDLVDKGVVAEGNAGRDRLNHSSVYGHNGYYTVDLFDAQYGILENDKGHSGGFTLRRVAFELLAEKGYYEGMLPYITNQYFSDFLKEQRTGETMSDTYVLQKIFKENEYTSFNDFRKKMFARRKEDAQKIKPINVQWWDANTSRYQTTRLHNYDSIKQLFESVLESNPYNRYAITNIKKQIFKEYLNLTDEFRSSIYRD